MMKLRVLLVAIIILNSCVQDDNYSIPEVTIKDPKLTANLTISDVKKYYNEKKGTIPLPNGIIEGYVSSTDAGGNIYKTLYIQDKAEKPTDALQIGIDASGLYSRYDIGRKVFVKLDGLSIGMDNGMLKIGKVIQTPKGELITIPSTLYKKSVIVSPEKKEIKPLKVKITELSDKHLGLLIKLIDVHSVTKGQMYYNKYKDRAYGSDRPFEDCDGNIVNVRVSSMATFVSDIIPSKRGDIVGLYTKYNKAYQLIIRTPNDVNLTKTYECEERKTPEPVIVEHLNENFDKLRVSNKGERFLLKGWYNISEKGDKFWLGRGYYNNNFAEMSGYGAMSSEIITWLITPGLDLNKAKHKNFSFDSGTSMSKLEELEVLVSTDFKGDVTKAKWSKLNVKLANKLPEVWSRKLVNSGMIDLSNFKGVVHIAFKYVGNNSSKSGNYKIDNVKFNYTTKSKPISTDKPTPKKDTSKIDNKPIQQDGNTNTSSITNKPKTLFLGSDFEDWSSLKLDEKGAEFVTPSTEGRNNTKALHIKNMIKTKNILKGYAYEGFNPKSYTKITFYIKGITTGKSLSINVYKADGKYERFNLKSVYKNIELIPESKNIYDGDINTSGKWVKVTLDISGMDLQTDTTKTLFVLKAGGATKKTIPTYDLLIDDIMIE